MNDEFLTHGLPDVRPAFERALQGRLHRLERRRTYAVASTLVVGLLLSLLLTLPPVRAQMHWLLREIGGLKFVETENPHEDWEAIRSAFSTPTPVPSLDGDYLLEEIVEAFPYILDAPIWKPYGYIQADYVNIRFLADGPRMTVSWRPFVCDSPCTTYIAFEIRKMTGGDTSTINVSERIASASAETVRFGSKTATLLQFHPSTGGSDGAVWSLVWRAERDGERFEYRLSSNDLRITREDMLRMANTAGYSRYVERIRQQRDNKLPMVNLPEILAAYPELARFLPAWLPPGFALDEQIPVDPINGRVILPWRFDNREASDTSPVYITLSIGRPWDMPIVVKPDTIQEVIVGDTVAAMWEVEFLREWDPEGRTYSLCCLQNDLQYCFTWREPGVTFDDIVRMVESIPDDARLPVDLEFLGDLQQE